METGWGRLKEKRDSHHVLKNQFNKKQSSLTQRSILKETVSWKHRKKKRFRISGLESVHGVKSLFLKRNVSWKRRKKRLFRKTWKESVRVSSHMMKVQFRKESHLRYKKPKVLIHTKVQLSGTSWKWKGGFCRKKTRKRPIRVLSRLMKIRFQKESHLRYKKPKQQIPSEVCIREKKIFLNRGAVQKEVSWKHRKKS